MKKLLHLVATPRGADSRTLRVTEAFLEVFAATHAGWLIDELNLAREELPSLVQKSVDGRYVLLEGEELYGSLKEAWQEILAHIDRFLSADAYLVSTPMWNFNIPYILKEYIDIIMQPRLLFRYTQTGTEGFAAGRRMVVITSRGGEYLSEEMRRFDHQEPYLRTIFGQAGITDITFVIAQPMDMGAAAREASLRQARERAREVAAAL